MNKRKSQRSPSRRSNPSSNSQMSIAKTALRKWGVISAVTGTLFAIGAVATVLHFWHPQYEARQFVRVLQDQEFLQVLPDSYNEKIDPKSRLAPIKSELLLREVLLDTEVAKTTKAQTYDARINEIQSKIRFEPAGGELYSIICKDGSPKNAAIIVQKVTEIFIDKFFIDYRAEQIKTMTDSLEKEIQNTSQRVGELEQRIAAIKKESSYAVGETGGLSIDIDGDLLVNLKKDLKSALLTHQQLEMEKELFETQASANSIDYDQSEIDLMVESYPEIKRIRDSLFNLENDYVAMKGRVLAQREQAADAIRRQRKLLAKKIDHTEKTVKFDLLRKKQAYARSQLADVEMKWQKNQMLIDGHKRDIEALSDDRFGILERQSRYFDLKDEKSKAEQLVAKWTDARDKIRSRELSPIRVSIAGDREVVVPTEPVELYPTKLLGMSGLGAFAVPFLLALLVEFRLGRISDPEQIRQTGTASLIGEVADLPKRIQSQNASKQLMKQIRLYEESVNSVNAAMRFGTDGQSRVVAICSAATNEGKTTLATQYAMSIARTTMERTLLIDCDLRSPSIHRVFDVPLEDGLVDVLGGEVDLEDAVVTSGIENLDVLPAGKLKSNPMRYFAGDEFQHLLIESLDNYSHIIVDTPPLLAASESVAIAKACDVAILCVMRDVSRGDSVRQAYGRLLAADVNVAGYVFGGVPQRAYAEKYGNYNYNLQ